MSPSSGPMLNWQSSSAGVRLLRQQVGNWGWMKRFFEKLNVCYRPSVILRQRDCGSRRDLDERHSLESGLQGMAR
jgi:hypothetical protein